MGDWREIERRRDGDRERERQRERERYRIYEAYERPNEIGQKIEKNHTKYVQACKQYQLIIGIGYLGGFEMMSERRINMLEMMRW